ncbi:hypothetical protein BDZ94DRAFT_1174131 [Collybia nuda]|uniref:LYR motif-containing protein 2 n=1 Tax=Collybia nuda TaxID=64659 RepID=A0A9P6CEP8_9AGAR|nr:hypothetical protein BDZ94DRAFT_1174131 [Collybia nuda]
MPPTPKFTLRHFILKQEVFNLYRYAIRSSRVIPDHATRRETIAWIRSEFERNQNMTDVEIIEEKLKLGRREIKQILPSSR